MTHVIINVQIFMLVKQRGEGEKEAENIGKYANFSVQE
jgi:hypothetical protein